jgi:uncharacterized protein
MPQHCVDGPAGVVFTPDELLIIWAYLTRLADTENAGVRQKIQRWLERREECQTTAAAMP